jgi:hypothetical protein
MTTVRAGTSEFSYLRAKKISQALVAHACNPSYLEAEIRRIKARQKKPLSQKYPTHKQTNKQKIPNTDKGLVE